MVRTTIKILRIMIRSSTQAPLGVRTRSGENLADRHHDPEINANNRRAKSITLIQSGSSDPLGRGCLTVLGGSGASSIPVLRGVVRSAWFATRSTPQRSDRQSEQISLKHAGWVLFSL